MFHWQPLSLDIGWMKDLCGYLAGSLVLGAFSVTSMRKLRCIGIASNLTFISYAILAGALPILILHGLLLPVNVYHLIRIQRRRALSLMPIASTAGMTPAFRSAPRPRLIFGQCACAVRLRARFLKVRERNLIRHSEPGRLIDLVP